VPPSVAKGRSVVLGMDGMTRYPVQQRKASDRNRNDEHDEHGEHGEHGEHDEHDKHDRVHDRASQQAAAPPKR